MPPPPPPPQTQTPQIGTPQQQQQQQQHGQALGGANNNTFLHTVLNTNSASPARSSPRGGGGGGTSVPGPQFSATQRSAQARGKEYNTVGRVEESYESRQRREEAGRILESMEMLIWWSSARNESIPQTRHHFQNVVLGIEEFDKDVVWREEWEVEGLGLGVGSPRSAKGKEREKRRVSSGLGAAS